MTRWIVRNRTSGEEQLVESDGQYAPYDGDLFDIAELPRELDAENECWDWEAGAVVCRFTPQQARDRQWAAALAYREERRNAPLAVWGVFPDRAVLVNMSQESRITIMGAVNYATIMASQDPPLPSSFSFKDAGGARVTLDGPKTIALGLNVAVFSGRCDIALDAVEDALDDAIASGTPADEILAIDITADYPGAPGAGDLPSEPEN
jgi:hypothetical protein